MKSYTDIEQSQKLIELGIDIKTADMYWWYLEKSSGKRYYVGTMDDDNFNEKTDVPAWSLTALLSLLKPYGSDTYTMWGTLNGGAGIEFADLTDVSFQEDEPLDAVFRMVCWLKEKGKL